MPLPMKHSPFLKWSVRILLAIMVLAVIGAPIAAEARAIKASTSRTYRRSRTHSRRSGALVNRTAAYADLVIEAETGRILHISNAFETRYPASLTKMMTLYLVFQALETGKLHLGQRLWISENAAEQDPTKLGLRPGQTLRIEDAILGLVTKSANDAAVVLAEAIGGSEERFAQMMTRQAHALGMTRTVFRNASGLHDPWQISTAADLTRLGYALVYHYPQYYDYFGRRSFVYAGIVQHNHNRLMERYVGMDGIKTGYTRQSGFNLVASAVQGQTRLIGTILGGRCAATRDNQMAQLLDRSFSSASFDASPSRPPLVLASQRGESLLTVGDYLPLPSKVSAIFAPQVNVRHVPLLPPAPRPQLAVQPFISPSQPEPASASEPSLAPVSSSRGRWGIQIGAFTDASIGQSALADAGRALPELLEGAGRTIQRVSINDTITYRVRFLDLNEKTARKACVKLIAQKQSCLVVRP
jgi:D-alanyl-D-alanine carboxypeptidase